MAIVSKLPKVSAVVADDIVPIVHNGDNYSSSMAVMKEYFRDSTLAIFDELDDAMAIKVIATGDIVMHKHGKDVQGNALSGDGVKLTGGTYIRPKRNHIAAASFNNGVWYVSDYDWENIMAI